MKLKIVLSSLLFLIMTGCASLDQPVVTVTGSDIFIPGFGFYGLTYTVPDSVSIVDSKSETFRAMGSVQQLAGRVFELNRDYFPRGNIVSYESVLMGSEHIAFVLAVVKKHSMAGFDDFSDGFDSSFGSSSTMPVFPFYNDVESRYEPVGKGRMSAHFSKGYAFERKGWYYPKRGSGRIKFVYEGCRVQGSGDEEVVLMGFCLPGNEHLLSLKMQEMVDGFAF